MSREKLGRHLQTNAASCILEALAVSKAADERALRKVDPLELESGRRRREGCFMLLLALLGVLGIAFGLWAVFLP